jgi:dipeptidyl aminopeptidase/acylaminoacyl peptidase
VLSFGGWYFKDFLKEKIFSSEEIVIEKQSLSNNQKSNISKEKNSTEEIYKEDLVVAKGQIKTATLTENNKIIYFNQNNFLEIDSKGGQQKNLASHPFQNLKNINCDDFGKNCLVQEDQGFSVYNLRNKEKKELNSNIKTVDFNSQQDGLIYLYKEEINSYQLSSSDLTGENWFKLKEIRGENLKIVISPKDNKVSYFYQKADKEQAGIYLIDLIGLEAGERINEKDIIDLKWSPDGNRILFSFYDHSVSPKRVNLGYYNLETEKEYILGLPGLAQKCVWEEDSNKIYCGILANTEQKEFDLEKWFSREFVSSDFFWEINLVNGERKRLFVEENYQPVDAFDLFIVNGELFMVDKISGNLIKRAL